ncbi:ABC transporter permease [bacterium]|nr:ABC transporter permease [bacterium]
MIHYFTTRLGSALITLFFLAVITFFTLRLAPGGPFDTERATTPEIQASINQQYGLDRPLIVQFADWFAGAAKGDLKTSFQYLGRPVSEIIFGALPNSLVLGGWALLFAVALGLPLGALAAWKQNTVWDFSAMFAAVAGVCLPSYLVASVLILVFSMWLHWFPPALWEGPQSYVLPVITLGLRPMAILARLIRASMIEVLRSDYIRTARAKGLSQGSVVMKHALKNSLIPVVTLLGPIMANLVTGSFLVEYVFEIPGMGKHFITSVINRDYPLALGVTLIYGVILISCNFFVDVAYGYIDPRIRVLEEGA